MACREAEQARSTERRGHNASADAGAARRRPWTLPRKRAWMLALTCAALTSIVQQPSAHEASARPAAGAGGADAVFHNALSQDSVSTGAGAEASPVGGGFASTPVPHRAARVSLASLTDPAIAPMHYGTFAGATQREWAPAPHASSMGRGDAATLHVTAAPHQGTDWAALLSGASVGKAAAPANAQTATRAAPRTASSQKKVGDSAPAEDPEHPAPPTGDALHAAVFEWRAPEMLPAVTLDAVVRLGQPPVRIASSDGLHKPTPGPIDPPDTTGDIGQPASGGGVTAVPLPAPLALGAVGLCLAAAATMRRRVVQ